MKSNKKPVLYFFTGSYPYGGVETFIENEIDYLASSFEEIIIVPSVTSKVKREVPKNVKIEDSFSLLFQDQTRKIRSFFSLSFVLAILHHKKFLFNITALRRINSFVSDSKIVYQWLNKNKVDNNSIIYTYWLNGKTFGAINYKTRKKNNLKIVSRAHRYDLYDYWFDSEFWPYRQKTLDLIDQLFVISQDGIEFLSSKYHTKNNISISRLGITDKKNLGETSSDEVLRIVSVANLNIVKRIPLLLKYLDKISEENLNQKFEWTHFGDGSEMVVLNRILKQVKSKNLKVVLKGRVSNIEIYKYYKNEQVDVFINVSESEGVPVSIMEAQSFGKFVIATDVGGTKELILKDNGYLIPKDFTYDEFKKAIKLFITRREFYSNQKNEIRKNCLLHYDAAKNYKEFTKSIIEIFNEK